MEKTEKTPEFQALQSLSGPRQLEAARQDRMILFKAKRRFKDPNTKPSENAVEDLPDEFFIEQIYTTAGWVQGVPQSYGTMFLGMFAQISRGTKVIFVRPENEDDVRKIVNYYFTDPVHPDVSPNHNSAIWKNRNKPNHINGSIYNIFHQEILKLTHISQQMYWRGTMCGLYYLFQPISQLICGELHARSDLTGKEKNKMFLEAIAFAIKPDNADFQRKQAYSQLSADWIADTCWAIFREVYRKKGIEEVDFSTHLHDQLSLIQACYGQLKFPGVNPQQQMIIEGQFPEYELFDLCQDTYEPFFRALLTIKGLVFPNLFFKQDERDQDMVQKGVDLWDQQSNQFQIQNNPEFLGKLLKIWWRKYGNEIARANSERIKEVRQIENFSGNIEWGVANTLELYAILVKNMAFPTDTLEQRDQVKRIVENQIKVALQFFTQDYAESAIKEKEEEIRESILKVRDIFSAESGLEADLTKQILYYNYVSNNLYANFWRFNAVNLWNNFSTTQRSVKHFYYSNSKYNFVVKPPLVNASLAIWRIIRQIYYNYTNTILFRTRPFYLEQNYTQFNFIQNNQGQLEICPNYLAVLPLIQDVYYPEDIVAQVERAVYTKFANRNQFPSAVLCGRWLMLNVKTNEYSPELGQSIQVEKLVGLPLYEHMGLFRLHANVYGRRWSQNVCASMTFAEVINICKIPPIFQIQNIVNNISYQFDWEGQDNTFEFRQLLVKYVQAAAERLKNNSTPLGTFLEVEDFKNPNESFVTHYNFTITSQRMEFKMKTSLFLEKIKEIIEHLQQIEKNLLFAKNKIEREQNKLIINELHRIQFEGKYTVIGMVRNMDTTRVYSDLQSVQADFMITNDYFGISAMRDMATTVGVSAGFYDDREDLESGLKHSGVTWYEEEKRPELQLQNRQIPAGILTQFHQTGINKSATGQWWNPTGNICYKFRDLHDYLNGVGIFLRGLFSLSGNFINQDKQTIHSTQIDKPLGDMFIEYAYRGDIRMMDNNQMDITPTMLRFASSDIPNRTIFGLFLLELWKSISITDEIPVQKTISELTYNQFEIPLKFVTMHNFLKSESAFEVYKWHLAAYNLQMDQQQPPNQLFISFLQIISSKQIQNKTNFPLQLETKLGVIYFFYNNMLLEGIDEIKMRTTTKDIHQSAAVTDFEVTYFMRKINDVALQSIFCLSKPEIVGIIATFQYHSFPFPADQFNRIPHLNDIIGAILNLEQQFSCLQLALYLFWCWREYIKTKYLISPVYREIRERNAVYDILKQNIQEKMPKNIKLQSISQLLKIIKESDFAKQCSVKLLDPNRYDRCIKVLHQQTEFIPGAPGVWHNFYIILNHVFYSQYEIKCVDEYENEKIQLYNSLGFVPITGSDNKYQDQTTNNIDELYKQAEKSYIQMKNYYYDIECYQVQNEKKECDLIPFLLCVIGGQQKEHFLGENCVAQFLDYLYEEIVSSLKNAKWGQINGVYNIYGFNSSKFDAIFVLRHLIESRGMNFTLTGEVTSPKSIKLNFPRYSNGNVSDNGHLLWFNVQINFLDLKLVSKKGGLADQAKVYLQNKPEFQKSKISPYGKGVIFDKEAFLWDEDKIVEYCYQDCLALKEIHRELVKQLYVQLNKIQLDRPRNQNHQVTQGIMNMICSQATLASLCYKTYKMMFLPEIDIFRTNQYEKLKEEIFKTSANQKKSGKTFLYGTWDKDILKAEQNSYHGGYCVVHKMNFVQQDDQYMTYWDFNSLYPTAMTMNKYFDIKSTFPYKTGVKSQFLSLDEFDYNNIYRIQSFLAPPGTKLGFIAVKQKNIAQLIYPLSYRCGDGEELWLWGQEIHFLTAEYGYKFEFSDAEFSCVKYEPENEVDMFSEYVNCFNKMKEEGDKEKNNIKRTFAKDFMNSLYGIFGFKKNEQSLICKDDVIMSFQDDVNPFGVDFKKIKNISKAGDIRTIKVKPEHKTDVGTLVRFASKITSIARITLWWHMKLLSQKLPEFQFYACDTDSIMCSHKCSPQQAEQILLSAKIAHNVNSNESQLGKLKMEYGKDPIIIQGTFIMKKTYKLRFFQKKAKSVYKIKGIKQENDPRKEYGDLYVNMDQFHEDTDSSDEEGIGDIFNWAKARSDKYRRISHQAPFSELNEISFKEQLRDYYISKMQLHQTFRTFRQFKGNWNIRLEQFQQWQRSVDGVIIKGAGDKHIKQTLTYQQIIDDFVNNIQHESYRL